MHTVVLKKGKVQPVWAGHPWVFAQAIERVDPAAKAGDVMIVKDPEGKWLGAGFYSPNSAIPVRLLTRTPELLPTDAWLSAQVERAYVWRKEALALPRSETNGYRLIHAEGDQLPGLIVDVFDQVAVMQVLTIGMKQRQQTIIDALLELPHIESVMEVSGGPAQKQEGFDVTPGLVGGLPVEALRFREHGLYFELGTDLLQKTGYYFDQRENRARVSALSAGKTVLDLYAYVGGFGFAAARGGATEVLSCDSSAIAIKTGQHIAETNGLNAICRFEKHEIRKFLADFDATQKQYDIVIVDPPKLVPKARHLARGRKAYRRTNAAAIRTLKPGGTLVSCSCSAAMKSDDFIRTVALAASDSGRRAVLMHLGFQGSDHPTPAAFSDGRYLKCAFFRID